MHRSRTTKPSPRLPRNRVPRSQILPLAMLARHGLTAVASLLMAVPASAGALPAPGTAAHGTAAPGTDAHGTAAPAGATTRSAPAGTATPAASATGATPAQRTLPGPREPADDCAPMTPARLRDLVQRIDPEARTRGNVWAFELQGQSLALVFDTNADRMRLMMPVTEAENVDAAMMERLLEANFDTALDARYALARGTLWATFIHPLSTLSDAEFASAVAQTASVARTYGSTFSSGAFTFRGDEDER